VDAALPESALARLRPQWERAGITAAEFPDLPERIDLPAAGDGWAVFPALVTEEDAIAVRLLADPVQAVTEHTKGVLALYREMFRKDMAFLKKRLKLTGLTAAMTRPFGGTAALEAQLMETVLSALFAKNIRTAAAFHDHAAAVKPTLMEQGQGVLAHCRRIVLAHSETVTTLTALRRDTPSPVSALPLMDRLEKGLRRLVPPQFVSLYDVHRLEHLPRYLAAVGIRARRGVTDPAKEAMKADIVDRHEHRLMEMLGGLTQGTTQEKRAAVEDYFWMIEEFKVSVFAQELGTARKVSEKRLERLAEDIQRMV
jgi:ATP-dependent helicase HrpA